MGHMAKALIGDQIHIWREIGVLEDGVLEGGVQEDGVLEDGGKFIYKFI
jgi:hypothetical protein